MTKISVIIPIYNALNDLKILLDSILKNFNFNLGEVILVNDHSDEQTSNFLNAFCVENKQIKLLNNEENLFKAYDRCSCCFAVFKCQHYC